MPAAELQSEGHIQDIGGMTKSAGDVHDFSFRMEVYLPAGEVPSL